MNRRDFLGLVAGFSAAPAIAKGKKEGRVCRQATTYRADCHGVPPTEPDDGSLRSSKEGSLGNKGVTPSFKQEAARPKAATYPPVDVDMCSALSVRDRRNSPTCTPR